MIGAKQDDGTHDIRGECAETLGDGDDHRLTVGVAASQEHRDVQGRDEDVLLVSSICALMVLELDGDEPDRLEADEEDEGDIGDEHLSAESGKCVVVLFTAVLDLQVQDDTVEQEPDGVDASLDHGLVSDVEERALREERVAHEGEDEFPGPVEAEDHERHTAGFVLETSVDDVDVNDGPEDTGHKGEDRVDRFVRNQKARDRYFF